MNRNVDLTAYVDASYSSFDKYSSWSCILLEPGTRVVLYEEVESAILPTELSAELETVFLAMRLHNRLHPDITLEVRTDNQSIVAGYNKRLEAGLDSTKKLGKTRKQSDKSRWRTIVKYGMLHSVEMSWVKGHADDPFNCRADNLAVIARKNRTNLVPSGTAQRLRWFRKELDRDFPSLIWMG